ncbi:MAG: 2'-5' RNA ligase family protein [Acidobacteria bacterium]|nr:2'-5' RNA ligase family protein [Acidobacteriota bacterium]
MPKPIQYFAIWLVPGQPDNEYFAGRIQDFSQRFGAIPFPPHLTLYAGVNQPIESIRTAIEVVFRGVTSLTLVGTGLQISPSFFKTLFVEFAPHPDLAALALRLQQQLDPVRQREFHPHLSLRYHDLPLQEKEALLTQMTWEARTIRFDEVCVVFPPSGERGWKEIAAWKTVYRQQVG